MRPTWSGAVSFGLVNIPVNLYSASQDKGGLSFRLLHEKDMSPVGYAKVCKAEGSEVPQNEIVRGFEYEKDEYVVIEDEDFKRADARRTKTIDIVDFVCEEEIDPLFYEKPYYLAPDRGADKPYALLLETLRRAKKVGIARFVLRDREHLAVIKPFENVLVLNQIRFVSEVRDHADLKLPSVEIDTMERELEMALALVDAMTVDFKPEAYHDTYTEKLRAVIDEKLKGKPAAVKDEAAQPTDVQDLMEALKASMERSREKAVA